jgi:hypothetical protein
MQILGEEDEGPRPCVLLLAPADVNLDNINDNKNSIETALKPSVDTASSSFLSDRSLNTMNCQRRLISDRRHNIPDPAASTVTAAAAATSTTATAPDSTTHSHQAMSLIFRGKMNVFSKTSSRRRQQQQQQQGCRPDDGSSSVPSVNSRNGIPKEPQQGLNPPRNPGISFPRVVVRGLPKTDYSATRRRTRRFLDKVQRVEEGSDHVTTRQTVAQSRGMSQPPQQELLPGETGATQQQQQHRRRQEQAAYRPPRVILQPFSPSSDILDRSVSSRASSSSPISLARFGSSSLELDSSMALTGPGTTTSSFQSLLHRPSSNSISGSSRFEPFGGSTTSFATMTEFGGDDNEEELSLLQMSRILQRSQGDSPRERSRLLLTLDKLVTRTDPTLELKFEDDQQLCVEMETLIAVLVWTLQRHVSISVVQQAGCTIWKNLVLLTDRYTAAENSISSHLHVIVDCLLGALLRHASNATIAIRACDALTSLVGRILQDRTLCRRVAETIVSTILQTPHIYRSRNLASTKNLNSTSSRSLTNSSATLTTKTATTNSDYTSSVALAPRIPNTCVPASSVDNVVAPPAGSFQTTTQPSASEPVPSRNDGLLSSMHLLDKGDDVGASEATKDEQQDEEERHEQQRTSTEVHQAALGALRLLGYSMRESSRWNTRKGKLSRPILDTLVSCMQRFAGDVVIQGYACETIWNIFACSTHHGSNAKAPLITKDPQSNSIILFEAISAIVTAMKEYPDHLMLQEMAFHALASLGNLIDNDNIKLTRVLESESAISQLRDMANAMVEAMQRHSTLELVQIAACSAVCSWTSSSSFASSSSFSSTTSEPQHHHGQELHFSALCHIFLATRGMINAIFATMSQHLSCASIQKRAAGIMYQFVLSKETTVLKFVFASHSAQKTFDYSQRQLVSGKAMEALFLTVKTHPSTSSTLEPVCRTLAYLLECRNPNSVGERDVGSDGQQLNGTQMQGLSSSSTLLKASQRVNAIMSTLQRFPQNAVLATSACQILGHFVVMTSSFDSDDCVDEDDMNAKNQLTWTLRGVPALVISCMQQNMGNELLQEVTCSILRRLVDNEINHECFTSVHGLDIMFQVMKRHPDNELIQTAAGGMLQALAIRLDSVPITSVQSAIRTITDAMNRHVTVASVQQGGLFALRFWSWDGFFQEWMLESSCRGRIVSAMEQHAENALVQQVGCDLLGALARHEYTDQSDTSETAPTTISPLGRTVQVLLSVVRYHGTLPALQQSALEALLRLLRHQDTQLVAETIKSTKGLEIVLASMERHPQCTILQQHACNVLLFIAPLSTDFAFERSNVENILNVMREQMSSMVVQNAVSTLLNDLSECNANLTCCLASSKRSLDTLVESLQYNVKNDIIASNICCLFARLVATPDCKTTSSVLNSSKGIETVIAAMQEHKDNSTIQKEASVALCFLVTKHSNLVAILSASSTAIESMVAAMMQNGENSIFQELGCRVLCDLAATHEATTVPLISAAGGVDVILRAMESDLMNGLLQDHACSALGKLAIALDSMVSPDSGIATIVSSMQAHPLKHSVQEGGLSALRFLSWSPDNQRIMLSCECIEAIVSAMRLFPSRGKIQELACGTLDSLATSDKINALIASSGAIDLILVGMRRHAAASPLVPEYGCGVLGRIAMTDSSKFLIGKFGGIDTIISTMKICAENASVQKEAFGAIFYLTAGDPVNHATLVAAGGVDRVLSAMNQHQSKGAVQRRGCAVLLNLCFTRESRISIFLAGGIDTIGNAMRNHQDDSDLQKHAFGALLHLSLDDDHQVSIAASGGFNSILATMSRHIEDHQLQEMGCDILVNLAANQAISKSTLAEIGIGTIVSAMKHHADSVVIQERGCDALVSVAIRLVSAKSCPVAKIAIDAVLSAMGRHTIIEPVQERSLQALRFYALNRPWQDYIVSKGGGNLVVLVLQMHEENEVIQAEACGALGDLAVSVENKLALSSVIMPLLSALDRNYDNETVQESCFMALGALAEEESNQVLIASSGGIEAMLKTMRRDPGKVSMQMYGCAALSSLAMNDANKASIGAAHGINTILAAMRNHGGHSELQKVACHALWHLASNTTNQVIIASVGGIDSIVSTMKRYPTSAAIQKRGCGALGQLALNVENQFHIASAGRVDVILTALERHRGHTGVQLEACRAIKHLASSSPSRRIMSSLVVVESVLSAMEENPDRGSVQEVACEALLRIDLDPSHRLWKRKIATILSSMRRNEEHAGVQESCLGVLRCLSLNDKNKAVLASSGAITTILSTMRRHDESELIQERSCATLWNLSYRNMANKVSIGSASGIEAVLSAMKFHGDSAAVQEEGCGVLWDLAFEVLNRSKIGSLGGVSVLLTAMRNFRSDVSLQGRACASLSNLVADRDIGDVVSSSGGIDDVVVAMSQHPMDSRVQEGGCRTLARLALMGDKDSISISSAGGIQVILSALGKLAGSRPILEHALLVLEKLVLNEDSKMVIFKAGGIDLIVAAMKLDLGNSTVQNLGCSILAGFASTDHADKVAIVAAGGIEIIVSAMEQHKENVSLQYHAGRVLLSLSFDKFCRDQMEDLGAMSLVEAAIADHGDSFLEASLDGHEDNPAD